MTPAMILLARACRHPAEATYTVPRLPLDRRPFDRVDHLELTMWRALGPIVAQHPGARDRIRQDCPSRWLAYLDFALALPEWLVDRAEPTADLLARYIARGSANWQLPYQRTIVVPHPEHPLPAEERHPLPAHTSRRDAA